MDEDIVNINFWKEIHREISDTLSDMKGVVLLAHNSIEFTDILDLLNMIKSDRDITILYISLVRSYDLMNLALNRKSLDKKQLFFIDCVSKLAFPSEQDLDDCLFLKPPYNFEEMKEIIKIGIEKSEPEIIVIDSITQFINFSRPTEQELNSFYRFLHTLKEHELNIFQDTFILLYDSRMSMMQNLPKFLTDLILKVEILKEESRWKD